MEIANTATSAKSAGNGLTPMGQDLGLVRRWLLVVVILGSALAATVMYVAMSPILPLLAAHFGGGENGKFVAQVSTSVVSIGLMLGGLTSGWMIRVIGYRWLMITSILAFGVLGVLPGLVSDVWLFCICRFVLGIAGAAWTTAAIGLIAEVYDDRGRLPMISAWHSLAALGGIVIVPFVGQLAKAYGWQGAFALYAILAAPVFILAVFVTPKVRHVVLDAATPGGAKTNLWTIVPILVMIFFLHIIMLMGNNQIPFVLVARGLDTPAKIAGFMVLTYPVGGIAALCSGWVQMKFGMVRTLRFAIGAAGVGLIIVGLAPNLPLLLAGCYIAGIGGGLFAPLYMTLPLARVSVASRGTAIGLIQFAMFLGAFMNPIVLAPFDQAFGGPGTYVAVGVIALAALVGTLVVLALLHSRRPPAQAAVEPAE